MNRYDLRRWFGEFPELPGDAWQRDTDKLLSDLKKARNDESQQSIGIADLLGFAFSFGRLESLSNFLSPEDWGRDARSILHRGHLRFYRAIAENPDTPESPILSNSATDFKMASDDPSCAHEALAGLCRLTALEGGARRGMVSLLRLERSGGHSARRAAAGVRIFMAELPGTGDIAYRRHLKKARKHLKRCGHTSGDRILVSEIESRLGNPDVARRILERLAENGCNEARLILIRIRARDEESESETGQVREELKLYRECCPFDPRSFMLDGELQLHKDSEAARIAWRTALVMDDRHAPAWARLGDLYKEAWDQKSDELGDTWLEAASDAYVKAVALAPLESQYRVSLGQVERDLGRPGRAISTLTAALALVRDDTYARRLLALSWTDLSYSTDLNPEARFAAAGRARTEWMRLLERGHRDLFDVIGLCRSVVLESRGNTTDSVQALPTIDSMLPELERNMDSSLASELIPLAEDFLAGGFADRVPRLIEIAEKYMKGNHRILALKASVTPPDKPTDAMTLYLEAADAAGEANPAYVEWLHHAAVSAVESGNPEKAFAILRKGLGVSPDDRLLLGDLSAFLVDLGRETEALEVYNKALKYVALDEDLLEDAIWFARDRGMVDEAQSFLEKSLELNPDNSKIWNQLGVQLIETGWDDEDHLKDEALDNALNAYRKAVEIEPENSVYKGNLGDALRQVGAWSEAAELLEQAAGIDMDTPLTGEDSVSSANPADAFVLNSLARLKDERSYSAEGSGSSTDDWDSAGILYHLASDAVGKNPDYLRDYAWWLYRERRLEEAAFCYQDAAILDPEDESLPYGEASCWRELGNESRAMEALDRALAICSDDPAMMADKAELMGLLGNNGAALKLFDRILGFTGQSVWVLERLALYLENAAEAALESADHSRVGFRPAITGDGNLDLSETFEAPFSSLTGSTESKLLFADSLQTWQKVLETRPGDKDIQARIGVILMALGRKSEARDSLVSSLNHNLTDADTLNRLGRLDLDLAITAAGTRITGASGRRILYINNLETIDNSDFRKYLDSAGGYLKGAAGFAPAMAAYHADLGYFHVLSGSYQSASRCFAEAFERDRLKIDYAAHAGITSFLAGDAESAAVYLQEALSSRNEAEWQNILGLSLLATGTPEHAVMAFRKACLADPNSEVFIANLTMASIGIHGPEDTIQ